MCISVMCIDASGDLPKQISIVTRALASALHEQEGEIAPTASPTFSGTKKFSPAEVRSSCRRSAERQN